MLNRRDILRGIGGLATAPLFLHSMAAEAAGSNDLIIVAILLGGGNDGLNTVVPLKQIGAYTKLRTPAPPPTGLALAYTEAQLAATAFEAEHGIPPANSTTYAFAPSMTAMRALYATGNLAVIAGVGLPPAETNPYDHTKATLDWLTGQINVGSTPPTGWLGLSLDHAAAGVLGPTASLSGTAVVLTGSKGQPLVINPPMDNFGISYGTTDDYTALETAFRQITALAPGDAPGVLNQATLKTGLSAITQIQSIAHHQKAKDYLTPTYLDYQLRDIARLIIGGAGMRGFFAEQGGYDTHSTQATQQPLLLAQLGASITTFYNYLKAANASSNVVIMTMSDFGRTPQANLSWGTDHGGSTVSFVFGDRVNGGVFGDYPSLTHFDINGQLRLAVDFRNVLSDLIGRMGGNPTTILGKTWPRLGFI